MKSGKAILIGAFILLLGIVLYAFSFYNNLISQTQAIDGQWAQVETQYQRRFDLIPNLVNSVQGLFSQEQAVFGEIAKARTKYSGAKSVDEKAKSAGELESALGRLLVIVENYPNIKSNTTVAQLMDDLAGTENRISVERRRYNELVQAYNTKIKQVPGNIFAGIFGFSERTFFKAVEAAEKAPKVKFN